ncbi:MAG: protein kinase [Deltaproteobacteria bacterium]|nr:protein kinase [Deltaproteobacteria bacterium]
MQAEPPTRTRAPYRRLLTIASGGMGRVDLSSRREGTFERLYAVKHLHAHVREDAEMRAMFLDEARIAGLLRHPNVVSVVDVGEDDEGPFLVMDYVEGVPLTSLVKRSLETETQLPIEVALRIAIDVARGLAAAHDLCDSDGAPLHLVHRDVSPHNVLVGFDGIARVTDFGIAKVLGRQSAQTSTGILKGKLGYMSPEQLRFHAPDRRSDLFSLGVVLYELLAGRRLYRGSEGESAALRILEEPPPDLADARDDAPPALVGLLFALLAKDPADRPSDAHAVEHALEEVLADLGVAATTNVVRAHMRASFEAERAQRELEVRTAQSAPTPLVEPAAASRPSPEHDAATRAASAHASEGTRRRSWIAAAAIATVLALVMGGLALDHAARDEGDAPDPEATAISPSETLPAAPPAARTEAAREADAIEAPDQAAGAVAPNSDREETQAERPAADGARGADEGRAAHERPEPPRADRQDGERQVDERQVDERPVDEREAPRLRDERADRTGGGRAREPARGTSSGGLRTWEWSDEDP